MVYVDVMSIHSQNPLHHALRLLSLIQSSLTASRRNSVLGYKIHRAMALNKDYEALNFLQPQITFCIDWSSLMAKNSNQPSFNLIDYRLSDSELESYEQWVTKTKPSFGTVLADFAEKDYKVSFSFVEQSTSWCCSITGKEDAKFNSKSTLTTWSDDPMDALAMAHFKVFQVFEGGVWKTKEQSRRG